MRKWVVDYIRDEYGVDMETPFADSPDTIVFRNNDCYLSKRSGVSQKPILSAFSKIVFRKHNFALQSLKGL